MRTTDRRRFAICVCGVHRVIGDALVGNFAKQLQLLPKLRHQVWMLSDELKIVDIFFGLLLKMRDEQVLNERPSQFRRRSGVGCAAFALGSVTPKTVSQAIGIRVEARVDSATARLCPWPRQDSPLLDG